MIALTQRVYVAGGSGERGGVASWIERLRASGVDITHDWTACEGYGRPATNDERRMWARQDLDGVRVADVVWYLAPHNPSEGSHFELGAAVALGKRVIASGPHSLRESRIFTLLAEHCPTHAAAFEVIVRIAGGVR